MEIEYNNKIYEFEPGAKVKDVFKDEIAKNNAIAIRFNNEVKSLNYELYFNGDISFIDISTKDGIRIYRKGLLFVIGKAIEELYPNTKMMVNFQLSNSLLCE